MPLDFRQHGYEGAQALRHVPVTGIIEAESGDRRAPVVKNRDNLAAGKIGPRDPFRHIGDAEPFGRRFCHQFYVIERERTRYLDSHFLAVFLKFPAVEFAARHTQADAAVALEVFRRLRSLVIFQVSW